MKKRIKDIALKKIGFWASIFVVSTIVTVSAAILILYFRNDPAMANAFSTVATILLAFAAITAIWYGSQQSRRLREENQRLQQENERRREEDRLHELRRNSLVLIHDWAQEAWNFSRKSHPVNTKGALNTLWDSTITLRLRAIDLKTLGKIFDDDANKLVSAATDNFIKYCSLVSEVVFSSKWDKILEPDQQRIRQAKTNIEDALIDLLANVSDIRIKYKL